MVGGKSRSSYSLMPEAKKVVRFWICFKSRLVGFANGSDIGYEGEKDSKRTLRLFTLATGRMDLPFTEMRKTVVESRRRVAGGER